jgi:hypothetical protein
LRSRQIATALHRTTEPAKIERRQRAILLDDGFVLLAVFAIHTAASVAKAATGEAVTIKLKAARFLAPALAGFASES